MDILLIENDPLIRDQVKVGLQQNPLFHVTVGSGYQGVGELRQHSFECVFLGVNPNDPESLRLLQHLRSFDTTTELVVMTDVRNVKDLAGQKAKFNIYAFLQKPLDPAEFFGFLGRFVERHTQQEEERPRRRAAATGAR